MKFDIVIIGGGAGAIGCAYALKNIRHIKEQRPLSVLLIEKRDKLGGTHINGWVNVHAATPAPPFMKQIIEDMLLKKKVKYLDANYLAFKDTSKLKYEMSFIQNRHVDKEKCGADWQEISIGFNSDDMLEKYIEDLSDSITIRLNTSFSAIRESKGARVISIITRNELVGTNEIIEADCFLDCSADAVLIRSMNESKIGIDYFYGIDARNKFGFVEENNKNELDAPDGMNYPTLMYRVCSGETEKLANPKYTDDALAYEVTDKYIYINTVSYLGEMGVSVIKTGEDSVYNSLKKKVPEHWSMIKNGQSKRLSPWDFKSKILNSYAPMLGIRETYRVACERMLNENNLYVKISEENVLEGDNLDKKIAVGNHPVDIHGNGGYNINMEAISARLKPYGIPYGCLIPRKLSNVLIASRGAGFTHIAAASFRLNKDMMQIGWAAGKAAVMFINDNLMDQEKDFRKINVNELQKSMDFMASIKALCKII